MHDVFGEPIRLNYNGQYTYKTALGGILTIISVIVALLIVISVRQNS